MLPSLSEAAIMECVHDSDDLDRSHREHEHSEEVTSGEQAEDQDLPFMDPAQAYQEYTSTKADDLRPPVSQDVISNKKIDKQAEVEPQDTTEDETDDTSLEDKAMPLLRGDFTATCRLAAKLGAAAMNNGSIAENIERFLPKLMEVYGYYGFFSCSTQQIACNFERPDPEDPSETLVTTRNTPIAFAGFQLTKLRQLSDLAKDLMDRKIGLQEANQRLDEIVAAPDPWKPWHVAVSFVVVGVAAPVLLGGTWWDVVLGPFMGALAYALLVVCDAWPSRIHVWFNLLASFLCSAVGFAVQLCLQPAVDPTIVTLSGILILLPSSTITLGINDLISGHVVSGFERLVKGMVILMWLAVGYVMGMFVVDCLAPDDTDWVAIMKQGQASAEPIPAVWRILFLPLICSAIAVAFQMTGPDLVGALLCMLVGYGTSYACVLAFDQPYLPSFLGSLTISTYANVWSRYNDRPNTIILFPSFQLLVAGVVGFMGLTKIMEGGSSCCSEDEGGGNQVLHMLLVSGIVVIGFWVGDTLVKPRTTI